MSSYDIALSGLLAAQRAIDLIGANISNASTEGYHRQSLVTAAETTGGSSQAGIGGVRILRVDRDIDQLLERQILLQQPRLGSNTQELATLQLIENALGNLDSQGLGLAIDTYFNAMVELAGQPDSQALQYQAVWAADAMAAQFRHVARFLDDLKAQINLEISTTVDQANGLIKQIAGLSTDASSALAAGGNANTLLDSRDQAVLELGRLVDVSVSGQADPSGKINVSAWGISLISGGEYALLDSGWTDGKPGITAQGVSYYSTDVTGGKIGGLISLSGQLVADLQERFDTLAKEIITATNKYHAEGIGTAGSFTELNGRPVSSEKLSEWSSWPADLSAGSISVRITNQDTAVSTTHRIDIDGDSTLESIAQDLDALTGLTASVSYSSLQITSSDPSLYTFDFLPAAAVDTTGLTGTSQPTVSGTFNGQSNETLTLKVVGAGAAGDEAQIGVTAGLSIEIRNGADELIKTVDVGLGYAAGDTFDLGNGLELSMAAGTVKLDEEFEIEAISDSDTSGLLAAAGINTFFCGTSASNIAVDADIMANPQKLASSLSPNGGGNRNVVRMGAVGQLEIPALGGVTPVDYLRLIVTGLGQNVSFRKMRQTAIEGALDQMTAARDNVSGVDINEEAASLMVYEKMFQAVAKFMTVQSKALEFLMGII
ncbi:MAG: flagellar hook-associated protein FlgK [Planctomycetes bacterium]|nr:flagellar hook-associated protein FlgK [Planctomycetota bacterium]